MSDAQKPAETGAATGGSRTKLFIIIGAVLLLGAGGGGAFMYMRPHAASAAGPVEHHAPQGVVSFEPFVANLADAGGTRFLRVSVRLILEEQAAEKAQKDQVVQTRLRSAILELLTQQTADQLVTTEGKTALKKAIGEHAGGILEPAKVSDVLFSDFVVQF